MRSTIEQSASGIGVQHVHKESLLIEERFLTEKDEFNSIIGNDINRPFDLSSSYPIRVIFYCISPEHDGRKNDDSKTLLLINMHHIASDGWSTDIFLTELFAFYNAWVSNDKDFRLSELEIQYKDYASWQRNFVTGDILNKQLSYWKNKLYSYEQLILPTN